MFKLLASLLFIMTFTFSNNESLDESHFTKIAEGSHSNIHKKQNRVISNNVDLTSLLNTINATSITSYNIPKIDFSKEQVVGLFMGSQKIEGYKIVVADVIYNDNETIVQFYDLEPTATTKEVNEMIISHPYYLAKIKKTNNSVKFVKSNC